MKCHWSIIWVTTLAIGLPGCNESDDTRNDDNSSVAELLKQNSTPAVEARICDLLENDEEQRAWLANSFETLESREQMGAIQAVCCVGARNAFEEFQAIVSFAINDEYMSVYAQQCLLEYDIPNRHDILRKHVAREADRGASIMFLRTYLELYGPGDIPQTLDALFTGRTPDEHKAEIAMVLVRHEKKRWLARALRILKKLMSPPVNLCKRAPNLAADVFKTLADVQCKGCDGLEGLATQVATDGIEPARTSAEEYLDAFNPQ